MATDDAEQAAVDGYSSSTESDDPSTEKGGQERDPGSTDDDQQSDEPTDEMGETDRGSNPEIVVGEYTWADFMAEYGYEHEIETLYPHGTDEAPDQLGIDTGEVEITPPRGEDWDDVTFDPESVLGYHPDDLESLLETVFVPNGTVLWDEFLDYVDPETTPVRKDVYTWEHYKWEYYYESDGSRPRTADGTIDRFDATAALGFDPDEVESRCAQGGRAARTLQSLVEERTVNVAEDIDEDAFFSTNAGDTTVTNRYDLEKAVPMAKKGHFSEVERYWVNKPYSFVIIFHSNKENEKKYYAVEPYCNEIEIELKDFLSGKLKTAITYSDDGISRGVDEADRRNVIESETRRLLKRYDLYTEGQSTASTLFNRLKTALHERLDRGDGNVESSDGEREGDRDGDESGSVGDSTDSDDVTERTKRGIDEHESGGRVDPGESAENGTSSDDTDTGSTQKAVKTPDNVDNDEDEGSDEPIINRDEHGHLDGIEARPEPVVVAEDASTISEYQVEKFLYLLKRNFIGYERIDPIKHDINVEDISCDGYNSPVFVYHSEYEQIISNIAHGEKELDDFVVKLAQRSGKGISKRLPQVDATLPDGSRAQLTLGKEVSDHGTNYTIRQFKDVPFTPIDLINWNTFSLDEMAFLWLAIENHKSLIFAGGTASGKTTSLNAVSLFIPSNAKIVSIEDTREVELPQRNWIASVTRPSFTDDEQGDVDEFDLLEAALRQRPEYIVMGEIRGEEGRTLFQVMSTGHTTYTTFHADSVDEVLKRFTTDPINVSKTMFSALDLVSIQTQTRVQGRKVRRNKSLTEINHYEAEYDEINVQDIYQWQAETDEFLRMGESNTLADIRFDRGWSEEKLEEELFKRKIILAYLIKNGLNTYAEVAATVQGFINDPDTILALIANEQLDACLEDLREMESVLIDVDPQTEALVPRPDATDETYTLARSILDRAESTLLEEYAGSIPAGLASALDGITIEDPITMDSTDDDAQSNSDADIDTDHDEDSTDETTSRDSDRRVVADRQPDTSRDRPRDSGRTQHAGTGPDIGDERSSQRHRPTLTADGDASDESVPALTSARSNDSATTDSTRTESPSPRSNASSRTDERPPTRRTQSTDESSSERRGDEFSFGSEDGERRREWTYAHDQRGDRPTGDDTQRDAGLPWLSDETGFEFRPDETADTDPPHRSRSQSSTRFGSNQKRSSTTASNRRDSNQHPVEGSASPHRNEIENTSDQQTGSTAEYERDTDQVDSEHVRKSDEMDQPRTDEYRVERSESFTPIDDRVSGNDRAEANFVEKSRPSIGDNQTGPANSPETTDPADSETADRHSKDTDHERRRTSTATESEHSEDIDENDRDPKTQSKSESAVETEAEDESETSETESESHSSAEQSPDESPATENGNTPQNIDDEPGRAPGADEHHSSKRPTADGDDTESETESVSDKTEDDADQPDEIDEATESSRSEDDE